MELTLDELSAHFNSYLLYGEFVISNEILMDANNLDQMESKLKILIDRDKMLYVKKGIDAIMIYDTINIDFTTNHKNALSMKDDALKGRFMGHIMPDDLPRLSKELYREIGDWRKTREAHFAMRWFLEIRHPDVIAATYKNVSDDHPYGEPMDFEDGRQVVIYEFNPMAEAPQFQDNADIENASLRGIERAVKTILDAAREGQEGHPGPSDFTTEDKFFEAVTADKAIKVNEGTKTSILNAMQRFGCFKVMDGKRWAQVELSSGATGTGRVKIAPICIANLAHWKAEAKADEERKRKSVGAAVRLWCLHPDTYGLPTVTTDSLHRDVLIEKEKKDEHRQLIDFRLGAARVLHRRRDMEEREAGSRLGGWALTYDDGNPVATQWGDAP
jgi:hypothetical protein